MKNLKFKELYLLSPIEKNGRRVTFDPKTTVILGANDTGKSSLIKSLYYTFGADPAVSHPRWEALEIKSLVHFSLDDAEYKILRDGTFYAIFDGDDNVLGTFRKLTSELSPFIADLIDFKCLLLNHRGKATIPSTAFQFLPFYVDQDSGWLESWSSFSKLTQFKKWRVDLANYFLGINTNELFSTKSKIEETRMAVAEQKLELKSLRTVRTKLDERFGQDTFSLDINVFQQEIEQLIERCQSLRKIEESYKLELLEARNHTTIIENQLNIANSSFRELAADYKFVTESILSDHVDCPTCGAVYENSIAEKFSIARDEDRVRELQVELEKDLISAQQKIEAIKESLNKNSEEIQAVEYLLVQKKGEIQLSDIIASEGRKEVSSVFNQSIEDYSLGLARDESLIKDVEKELREIRKNLKEKRKEVTDFFSDKMRWSCIQLDAHTIPQTAFTNLTGNNKETGSDKPRALLAYYYSSWHTAIKFGSYAFCPIVIDSPNQQAQDEISLEKILKFVFQEQPPESQLIVGLEDDLGVEHSGTTIKLEVKHRLLLEDEFESATREIMPLLQLALSESGQQTA